MPTFIKPARVDVIESGGIGGLVLIAAGIAAVAAVAVFIAAHAVLLASVASVFAVAMGAVIVAMRRAASPRKWAEYRYPRPEVTVRTAGPVQAITGPPLAIEPARILPAQPGAVARTHQRRT